MIKLPCGLEIEKLIDDLRTLSWEASETLLNYAQILKDSNNKSNILRNDNLEDPVTIADLKVNDLIIQGINKRYKDINWKILSEENVKILPNNPYTNIDWLWILDPLDGTKDFIQGTGNYAMHLALNYKQRPYIGIVLIPERNELWIADGENVWGERRDGTKINPARSKKKCIEDMILITSKNHRNENLTNLIKELHFEEVKIMGSLGCKIASIVRGESDIYICLSLPGQSSPKDWDFAAPEAILKASGGAITNLDNQDLSYNKKHFDHGGIIVASNSKEIHAEICLQIKAKIKQYNLYPLTSS